MATLTITVVNTGAETTVTSSTAPSFKYVTQTDVDGQIPALGDVIMGLIANTLTLPEDCQ
jgi:hypothetical protein